MNNASCKKLAATAVHQCRWASAHRAARTLRNRMAKPTYLYRHPTMNSGGRPWQTYLWKPSSLRIRQTTHVSSAYRRQRAQISYYNRDRAELAMLVRRNTEPCSGRILILEAAEDSLVLRGIVVTSVALEEGRLSLEMGPVRRHRLDPRPS